ncbi:isoleucine--tRNA ligase [Fluviispira multicolorata]|uniref:Isoleucine--tRNA ligase n=1 Tax=Fluviispira multicolorata TaxID=2654512 RepID=A0A833N553_9BACT|nr:isoleucine--tRNA ligase [Fluviispira multicolorata]KAB8032168.1 isoleucine--tRNA ligase [Fluviispira multicolorata]
MQVEKPARGIDFPAVEKEMLKKWDNENIFQRSILERPENKKYNFYDGPPFATGLPHFGHFVPSSIKDAFPRYFTMKGNRVERRFGWDCHGVPVELLVQKELGLNGKLDIENYGIPKFNQACRESVVRYTREWRNYIRRLGRWVDMENEYRTMDTPFMESVWHALKTLWDKGFIYESKFVVSYSSALGTTLSNFEASLDYRDVQDPSLTVKAKLKGKHAAKNLLVWTTTPWTLPANLAIAIDGKGIYAEVHDSASNESFYILKDRISAYWPKENTYKIVREILGEELENTSYEPFFTSWLEEAGENAFKVYATNYVLHDTGTGAVHTSPAFGEDDFNTAKRYDLPILDHLDTNGKFKEGNHPELVGLDFKSADKLIISDLKKRGFVFKHETFVHSYPHCYRSGLPLMYRAVPSWFVKIEENKELLLKMNSQINWMPDHIKSGRFGKWLENARDWNIGRSRYWGNPIPIWKNAETGEEICLGSVAELQKYTDKKITDIHMEFIDDIVIPSKKYPGTVLTRVPFVLDCWFESGSMPYAQHHYPFERAEEFRDLFPADFICEGLDQTRGWFYTLTLLSGLLFEKPAFKNVVVNGLVLAEDGRKMSKSLKNYPDPMATLDEFGADSVRLFLLSSPATVAEEVRFSVDGVKESTRRVLLPLWNAYSFFATYASIDCWDPEKDLVKSENSLDKWILLRLNELVKNIDEAMNSYQIAKAAPTIIEFFDDLNNWYIRRSRRRFWSSNKEAYSTLYEVLLQATQILAPFAPFAAEYFFGKLALTKELKKVGSVHLSMLPEHRELNSTEQALLKEVAIARRVVELGRTIRVSHKLKNRQPLKKLTVGVLSKEYGEQILKMKHVICEELNVKDVLITYDPSELAKIIVKPNFKILGKSLGDRIKELQTLLSDISQENAAKALRKETIQIKDFILHHEQVLIELRPSGSNLVATDAELVAALDPTLTEELRFEGIARELVSLIQKARKSADFNVEDKMYLQLKTSSALAHAINSNKEYIEDETLSQIVDTLKVEAKYVAELDCEGEKIEILMALIN